MQRKKKICIDCGTPQYLFGKSRCEFHYRLFNASKHSLKRSPIKNIVKPKRVARIKENKSYYLWAIQNNIDRNGECLCDECSGPIKNPFGENHGRLVCHIVSSGANETLYHEPENHFILGRGPLFGECSCGDQFDNSKHRHKMKIAVIAEAIRINLNHKYYTKKAGD